MVVTIEGIGNAVNPKIILDITDASFIMDHINQQGNKMNDRKPLDATHYYSVSISKWPVYYKMIDKVWYFWSTGSWYESFDQNKTNPELNLKEIK